MRFLIRTILYTAFLAVLTVLFCNAWVIYSTQSILFSDIDEVPSDIALAIVLGTSKNQVGGGDNLFFTSRIDAAVKLFDHKKVNHFILSGDNETKYYNEPRDMKIAMQKQGVPEHLITLDYAGLRTLDSIVRGKEVFGQDRFIIVTQKFHAYRAAFIAQFYGIDAVVFVAEDPDYANIMRVLAREVIARTNAVLDLYFFGTKPKYMDKKVQIKTDAVPN